MKVTDLRRKLAAALVAGQLRTPSDQPNFERLEKDLRAFGSAQSSQLLAELLLAKAPETMEESGDLGHSIAMLLSRPEALLN